MGIELQRRGCCTRGAAAPEGNFAHILVNRVRCQAGDRRAGLATQSNTTRQLAEEGVWQGVRAVEIAYVATIGVEITRSELIAEQADDALREVEEGADPGIGLAVVIAEEAFIVPLQFGEAIVGANQEAAAEVLVQLDFEGLVAAYRRRIPIWFTVGCWEAGGVRVLTAGSTHNVVPRLSCCGP